MPDLLYNSPVDHLFQSVLMCSNTIVLINSKVVVIIGLGAWSKWGRNRNRLKIRRWINSKEARHNMAVNNTTKQVDEHQHDNRGSKLLNGKHIIIDFVSSLLFCLDCFASSLTWSEGMG